MTDKTFTTDQTFATDKTFATETFRQLNSAFEPWISATKAWVNESEKLQRLAFDSVTKAMDNGHRVATEGLELITTISANAQKQMTAQVERANEMFGAMLP